LCGELLPHVTKFEQVVVGPCPADASGWVLLCVNHFERGGDAWRALEIVSLVRHREDGAARIQQCETDIAPAACFK
jgi:hypothetical protein